MYPCIHLIRAVARTTPQGHVILGSAFLVDNDGIFVTTRHILGDEQAGLRLISPHIADVSSYQHLADSTAKTVPASIMAMDPIRDLALLNVDATFGGVLPPLEGLDSVHVGDLLVVVGCPHAPDGQHFVVCQSAELAAKVDLPSQGVTSKYGVLNTQARVGQSGSLVLCPESSTVAGVLIGDDADMVGARGALTNIEPSELHQFSYCISAEYVTEMLRLARQR